MNKMQFSIFFLKPNNQKLSKVVWCIISKWQIFQKIFLLNFYLHVAPYLQIRYRAFTLKSINWYWLNIITKQWLSVHYSTCNVYINYYAKKSQQIWLCLFYPTWCAVLSSANPVLVAISEAMVAEKRRSRVCAGAITSL